MEKNGVFVVVVAVIVLAGLGAGLLWKPTATPADPLPLRIGIQIAEASTALFVADERGFFAENGLDVTLRPYAIGEQAIAAAEAGEVEVASASEYSVVVAAFDNRSISAIVCIDKAQTSSVIGRRDRGIAGAADLKGKRIGVTRRTTMEFYLGRLLDLNGMSLGDVTVVDVPRPQNAEALANGSVDAVVTATREVVPVAARLGGNAIAFSAQSDQPTFVLLVCGRAWAADHPRETDRLLRSIATANEYILANPAEAQAIAGRRVNMSGEAMASVWPNSRFALTLDRSLLTAMDDEARWMIANNLTTATTPPDLRTYVDTTALAGIDPCAVTIL